MKNVKLFDVILFLLALLFVYAASSKLMEYDLFKTQIGKSPLITQYAGTIAAVIPTIELLVAIALFLPKSQVLALYASFTLLFMFTIYIAFVLLFSPDIPCSCGGILNNLGWTEHLIFNVGFMTLPIIALINLNHEEKKTHQRDPVSQQIRP